jgi:hypothetical protein
MKMPNSESTGDSCVTDDLRCMAIFVTNKVPLLFLVPIILDGNAYNKKKNYSMNSQAGALELEKEVT